MGFRRNDQHPGRGCSDKVRYRTRKKAIKAICPLMNHPTFIRDQNKKLDAYSCACCEGWHIGHYVIDRLPYDQP